MIPLLSLLTSIPFLLFLPQFPFATCLNFSITTFNTDSIISTGGAAVSGGSIQLTDSTGAAYYYVNPIPLWHRETNQTADFATYFEFLVSFPNASSNSTPSGGFAFFLAPIDSVKNPTAGNLLGLSNATTPQHLLAVEFDSFRENSTSNSTSSSNVANNDTLAAQVSYNASSKSLLVSVKNLQASSNSSSLNLSHVLDMRQVLPEQVLVGFTATNGSAAVVQRITKWNFTSNLEAGGGRGATFKIWMLAPVAALVLAALVAAAACYIWRGRGSLRMKILYAILVALEKTVSLVCLPFFLCGLVKRRWNGEFSAALGESMDDEFSSGTGPRRFFYKDLATATSNFSEKRKLGEGGFGEVYKGFLSHSGKEVAVKKISSKSKQGRKEYASEVKIISRLRHRNLVQLIGWCHERGEFLLVYEFLPNGSLDAHLFNQKTSLPWGVRYNNVALGLAKALLYLHEEWEQCVVHRDVKSSNVMLDSGFNAKLGDFGLARMVDHKLGQHATGLAGTLGYLAPECFNTGKASREADVYSFGVVALEIATGRRAVEHHKEEEEVRLVEWVWELYGRGRLLEVVDRSLGVNYDRKEMERLMLVGLWCAHPDYCQRPTMREVIQAFTFEGVIPDLPKKMPVPVFTALPLPASNSSAPTVTFGSLTAGR